MNSPLTISPFSGSTFDTRIDGTGARDIDPAGSNLVADAARRPASTVTVRDVNGDPMTPVYDEAEGGLRVFEDESTGTTIVEIDTDGVYTRHTPASYEKEIGGGWLDKLRGRDSETVDTLTRTSTSELDEDFGQDPGLVIGNTFYNPGIDGYFQREIGPVDTAVSKSHFHDGQFYNNSDWSDMRLTSFDGQPGLHVDDEGNLTVVDDIGDYFVRDLTKPATTGDDGKPLHAAKTDADGNPILKDGVQTLIPGMRVDDLPNDQKSAKNGANLYVQIADDGQGGRSGTQGKTYVVQTPDGVEEPEALDRLFDSLDIDREGDPNDSGDGLREGQHYTVVAMDPGSSRGVWGKREGPAEQTESLDDDADRAVPTSDLRDDLVHDPFFMRFTPK